MTRILEGKTALVTGATRNLGRAIAEQLAAAGALVALNYANNDLAAQDTLEAIKKKGGKAFLIRQQLGSPESAKFLVEQLSTELTARTGDAGLDILINNVGGGAYADIRTTTPELFESTISTNIRAPFYLTQALLPHLRDRSRIVNLSSVASRLTLPEAIVYSMSKAAIDTFTRVLAKEVGKRGITVNAVLPGFNETESNEAEANDPVVRKQIEDMTAIGRFGLPSDIAKVVYALVSPDMDWVTGQIIEASGGFRL